jgi:hypothetical protein
MLQLRQAQFCGLSKTNIWTGWLKIHAPDLLDELYKTQRSGKGCRANREMMLLIKNKLYERGLGDKFEALIAQKFPFIVDRKKDQPRAQPVQKVITLLPVPPASKGIHLNKHNVFTVYRPDLLTFPHKLIIQDANKAERERKVSEFTTNKIGVNIVTIDDTAYIEYLLSKFADVLPKIQPTMYETKTYQQRMVSSNNS